MKEVNTFDSIKIPGVTIDPSLSKYKDIVICSEKVEKANKTLERIGLLNLKKLK